MARITVEDCLTKVGNENRFSLIHLAIARLKQHRKGQPFLTKSKNKEVVSTLREIASGDVTFENLSSFTNQGLEEDLAAIESETTEQKEKPTA